MKHVGIQVTFQIDGAKMYEHTTESTTDEGTYISGIAALDQLRDCLLNCAVSADINEYDGTITLTISK